MSLPSVPAAPMGPAYDRVELVGDGAETFATHALLALECRAGVLPPHIQAGLPGAVQRLTHAPLHAIAMQCLAHAGRPVSAWAAPEDLLTEALGMDGQGRFNAARAEYSPYNRPGSFPNILSGLANKILDQGLELSTPSYESWTGTVEDQPTLRESPIVAKSQADELDEVLDGQAVKELGLGEEMLSFMLVRRFGNKFGATPTLLANDDLQAFKEGLLGLETAWQNTVNRGCLFLLTNNAKLLDTFALFDDANHGNDLVAGGAAPSVTSWQAMQLKLAAQRGIGGKGYIRTPLGVALVPPKHLVAAQQLFAPLQQLGEVKTPATDANVNTYRGTASVVYEPELQADSADRWYGFCQPQGSLNATIVRAYFKGWGKAGKRERWYDPATKVFNFGLEGRVGCAAKQYRTAVRNSGVA